LHTPRFGCVTWSAAHPRPPWTFLLSRVIEKTSAYAVACLSKVYASVMTPDIMHLSQWTDGPRQFKSCIVLGSTYSNIKQFDLASVTMNYGAPCHCKCKLDRMFGTISALVADFALHTKLEHVCQVARLLQDSAQSSPHRAAVHICRISALAQSKL